MLALYIILGIIIFFMLILNTPIGIKVIANNDNVILYLCILFINIKIFPKKKKTNYKKIYKKIKRKKLSDDIENKKQINKSKKSDSFINKIKKLAQDKNNLLEFIDLLFSLLKQYSLKFKKHLHINIYKLGFLYNIGDEAQTSSTYGVIHTSIIGSLNFINNYSKLKLNPKNVSILPNYHDTEIKYNFCIKTYIRLICILTPALNTIIKFFIKYIKKDLKNRKDK